MKEQVLTKQICSNTKEIPIILSADSLNDPLVHDDSLRLCKILLSGAKTIPTMLCHVCAEHFRLSYFSAISSCLLVNLIRLTDMVWLKVRCIYLLATPAVISFDSRVGL